MPKQDTGVVVMDSRKFLGALNSSAQARIAAVESHVASMGKAINANWQLAALRGDHVFIEDVDSHDYYCADHRREKGGRVVIENVRPVKIVENKKRQAFDQACLQLVNAIEEDNQKEMATAYNRMAGQRFSGRSIPFCGRVRTHDGVSRMVNIGTPEVMDEGIRRRLIGAILEGVRDNVTVDEGRVVSGSFVESKIKLPITEWVCRKSIARKMRSVAEGACWSQGFQDRIFEVAGLIYEDKIEEAVRKVSTFATDKQEFTLLSRDRLQRLIEDTLATKACFNQQLCEDTATLFWRTNLKVNRRPIVEEWRKTAQKAGNAALLENVRLLEEAKNFEAAYDKFIKLVFDEATSPREVQVDAYKTALQALKETPKVKGAGDLTNKIDELIERLQQPQADHAVIAEVEDLLAEVKNELNAMSNLDNFDQIPGGPNQPQPGVTPPPPPAPGEGGGAGLAPAGSEPLGGGAGAGGEGTNVTFNININKGGEVSTSGGDLGGEEEGEEDLESLLGGAPEEGAPPAGGAGAPPPGPGGLPESTEAEDDLSEEADPYAYSKEPIAAKTLGSDYGAKPIELFEDCVSAVQKMFQIATDKGLVGDAIAENLQQLALAGINAAGIRVPARKRDAAISQVAQAFTEECRRRAMLGEDQYKWRWSYKGGRRRARYTQPSSKTPFSAVTSESVQWLETQQDGKLGLLGDVKFIFDHGGPNSGREPVILSEDGQIEVPIPQELHGSAFAAAKMARGNPEQFLNWLSQNLTQLAPITEQETRSLDEAVATVRADADGQITVEVSDEVEVDSEPGGMGDDLGGELGDEGPLGLGGEEEELEPHDEAAEMHDVNDLPPEIGGEEGGEPEFGGGEEMPPGMGGEEEGGPPAGGPPKPPGGPKGPPKPPKGPPGEEEEEPGLGEDEDITDPQSKKYTSKATENPRKHEDPPLPKKTDDKLKGFDKDGPTGSSTGGMKMNKVKPRSK